MFNGQVHSFAGFANFRWQRSKYKVIFLDLIAADQSIMINVWYLGMGIWGHVVCLPQSVKLVSEE